MALAVSSESMVSEPVTHYRMHTYRPGNLRDEIAKEGGFGPPRAVTPWKKKKDKPVYIYAIDINTIFVII
jgi:hypothetical protein